MHPNKKCQARNHHNPQQNSQNSMHLNKKQPGNSKYTLIRNRIFTHLNRNSQNLHAPQQETARNLHIPNKKQPNQCIYGTLCSAMDDRAVRGSDPRSGGNGKVCLCGCPGSWPVEAPI